MRTKWFLPLVLGLALCGSRPAVAAPLTITFDPALLTGSPGDALTFQGTFGNEMGFDAFLNSVSITLAGPPGWDIDATPFFENVPFPLLNGTLTGPVALFRVAIPGDAGQGVYAGDFIVLGGATENDQTILAAAPFSAQVVQTPVPSPEPGLLLLMGVGWAGAAMRRVHARRTASGRR
jgi:hypothetical protein